MMSKSEPSDFAIMAAALANAIGANITLLTDGKNENGALLTVDGNGLICDAEDIRWISALPIFARWCAAVKGATPICIAKWDDMQSVVEAFLSLRKPSST